GRGNLARARWWYQNAPTVVGRGAKEILESIPVTTHRGKILVIRGGAIGDFILTLPVLAALRGHFPQARLEVLGYPHIAQLALAGGLVDRVRSIDAGPLAGFFARNGVLDVALQEYFARFAII